MLRPKTLRRYLYGSALIALGLCNFVMWYRFLTFQPKASASQAPVIYDISTHNTTHPSTDVCKVHLSIQGTHVDEDVIKTEQPYFYLSHTLDGEPWFGGSLFIDERYPTTPYVCTVYGHAIIGSHLVFSDLKYAYTPKVFKRIGSATLSKQASRTFYNKLCAVRIPETHIATAQPVITTKQELHNFLLTLTSYNGSFCDQFTNVTTNVNKILIAVTCSENSYLQHWRCLVVFGTC